MQETAPSRPGKLLSLPQTRRLSLTAMVVEFGHQIVLSLWTGSVVAVASLAVPGLLESELEPGTAARAALVILGRLGFLSCGAGSFLLLTTLLMYLLSLRGTRTVILQASLLLLMTAIAVGLELRLAPELDTLLRENGSLFLLGADAGPLARFRILFTLYLVLLLAQAFLGMTLLAVGIRRWYRYVSLPEVDPGDPGGRVR